MRIKAVNIAFHFLCLSSYTIWTSFIWIKYMFDDSKLVNFRKYNLILTLTSTLALNLQNDQHWEPGTHMIQKLSYLTFCPQNCHGSRKRMTYEYTFELWRMTIFHQLCFKIITRFSIYCLAMPCLLTFCFFVCAFTFIFIFWRKNIFSWRRLEYVETLIALSLLSCITLYLFFRKTN